MNAAMQAIPLTQRGTLTPFTITIHPWASRVSCITAIQKLITPAVRLKVVAVTVSNPELDLVCLWHRGSPHCPTEHTPHAFQPEPKSRTCGRAACGQTTDGLAR